jgi:diguanylate cyclase (GGDEF)-like protein
MPGSIRGWVVWDLRPAASAYITAVVGLAAVVIVAAIADAGTTVSASRLGVYVALLGCGVIAVESAREAKEVQDTVSRDLQTVWYLAIAVTFPPVYAILAPIPPGAYHLMRVRRRYTYRRVLTTAAFCLAYCGASAAFHAALPSGGVPGAGMHAVHWTVLAGCGTFARLVGTGLTVGAIRLAGPGTRLGEAYGRWPGLASDVTELSVGVLLALVVAIAPVLMALALPAVVFCGRAILRAQLATPDRVDAATGVLTAAAWRSEAGIEVFRAWRRCEPMAVALVEIDQFSSISATAGPRAAREVLWAVAGCLIQNLPEAGQAGRTGGGRFAIVLPGAVGAQARRVAERVRDHVGGQPVAIESGSHEGYVFWLTVSIGLAQPGRPRGTVAGLVAAADGVLVARAGGRNRVCAARPVPGDLAGAASAA